MNSRRDFIRNTALGLAAAATLPALRADDPKPVPSAKPGPLSIPVDWHSHVITPGELKFLAGRTKAPRVTFGPDGQALFENVTTVSSAVHGASKTAPSDIATRIKHLDAAGVQRQLLSYTVAIGYDATIPTEELRVFYRGLNDELAEILRQHPGRFLGVAALPSGDPVWAAQELARAHQELGFIGAAVPLNAYTSLESARTQAPLFAAAQKFGSHVFVHRAPASPTLPGQPPLILPTDTKSVRWGVVSNTHLINGANTIDSIIASAGRAGGVKDPLARLRRIYLEPGPYSASNPDWVALAASKIGADRILFGTDYGVGGGTSTDRLAPSVAALDKVLDTDARQKIYVDNSRRLLKARGLA
jgi:predicted TIM-barrel fold metal-dependent hydrolase